MNHAYYVPSHQISYHISQQACLNRNADNIADQYKFIYNHQIKITQIQKHVNQSLHTNKDPHINQHKFKSQKNITSTKLHSSRRQKSQDVETIQQSINQAIKQPPKQSKVINGYMVKQQLNSNSYQSPKQQQIIDYQSFNKDKTVIKTEPDTQICSDRIICYRTPVLTSKQIQSKEQIKSICKQIYPLYKQTDETTNLKLDIRNENQNKNTKLKTDVPDKILDLLMLSTRELKIKLSEKEQNKHQSPKLQKQDCLQTFQFQK